MKWKILKLIIFSYFLSVIIGNSFYSIIHKNYTLANIIFFSASIKIQFIFSIINFFVFFVNEKNYYYSGFFLIFLPQVFLTIIFLSLGDYTKDSVLTFYLPFFIVQTFFYFRVRKLFSDLEI